MNELAWYERLHWRAFVLFVVVLILVSIGVWYVVIAVAPSESVAAVERALGAMTLAAVFAAGVTCIVASAYLRHRFADARRRIQIQTEGEVAADISDELNLVAQMARTEIDALRVRLARLEQEKGRLSALLEGMGEAVVMTDDRERVLVANPVAETLLSLPSDYTGRRIAEVCAIEPLSDLLAHVLWSDEATMEEIDIPRGSDVRHISISAAPIKDRERVQGAVMVLHDVTRLRRLERVRRDFVANVSHELRTPITTIQSSAETLLLPALKLDDVPKEFVETIFRNANRMASLVGDLLTLSRLEAAGEELSLEPIDLASVVAQVLDSTSALAKKGGVELVADLDEDLPNVLVEPRSLNQVLQNLVENAVKYTRQGGAVTIRATTDRGKVRISVSDTGVGIPREHIPRIFERFYRVDVGRSREVGGTGLGLAIVKHLVRRMDGHIEVRSVEGEGTTFDFWLPMKA